MPGPVIQGLNVSIPPTMLPVSVVVQGLVVKSTFTNVGGAEAIVLSMLITTLSGSTFQMIGEAFARFPNHSKRRFPGVSNRRFPRT